MTSGIKITPAFLPTLVKSVFEKNQNIYEAYSQYDQELREFSNEAELLTEIGLASSRKDKLVYLAIYYPEANGYLRNKKISLDPKRFGGAKMRYSIEGWGLVYLQLHFNDQEIICNINANSKKRAVTWFSTHPELKDPELWNWKEVNKQLNRLKRVLNKGT